MKDKLLIPVSEIRRKELDEIIQLHVQRQQHINELLALGVIDDERYSWESGYRFDK